MEVKVSAIFKCGSVLMLHEGIEHELNVLESNVFIHKHEAYTLNIH